MQETQQDSALGGYGTDAAIGARLRRLSEAIERDAARLYEETAVRFEQRWFGVLNQLISNGPMTVSEIATALRITHVSVSQSRRSLEAAEIVSSSRDPEDGRRRPLHITPKGHDLINRLRPLWDALQSTAEELDREAQGVIAALDRLDAVLEESSLYERVRSKLVDRDDG